MFPVLWRRPPPASRKDPFHVRLLHRGHGLPRPAARPRLAPAPCALSRRGFLSLSAAAAGLIAVGAPGPAPAQTAPRGRTLLKGGTVMTLDGAWSAFTGDVLIEGATIRAIAPEIDAEDARIVDCAGKIVMPASSTPITTCGRARSALREPTRC